MDNLKKSLLDKKKEQKGILTTLSSMYREYGEAQFEYAVHQNNDIPHINHQAVAAWETLREARKLDAETILNVKTIQSRQGELKAFHREVDKLLSEHQRDYDTARAHFILLFFKTYQNTDLPCIRSIAQLIEPLTVSFKNLEEEKKTLEQQKTDAHFLKKLTLTPQLLSLKTKAAHLQKKIDERILTAANELLTENIIQEVRGASFPEELEAAYSAFQTIVSKQDELVRRKETLEAEQEQLTERLTECGVTTTIQKRMTILTDKMRETDAKIEEAEIQQGIQYSDIFYTADGEDRGEPPTDVPESFKPYLTAIADYRIKLKTVEIDIECIENNIAYEAEEHKIETFVTTIERYRQSIIQYEALIETAERNIAQSEQIKQELIKRNKELKPHG